MKYHVLSIVFLSLFAITGIAQIKVPPLSAPTTLTKQIGFTTISISYESPAARWRTDQEIFGELVPFGKVWRTGAGPGTKISFNTDVTIGDKTVAAGVYALFSIPDKDLWTLILNTDTGAYNVFRYDPAKDVARVTAKPTRTTRYYPSLNFDIDFVPNDAVIYVSWINTQVSFKLQTGLDQQIMSYIKTDLLTGKVKDYQQFEGAVTYYEWHQGDQKELMLLIEKGIELKNQRWWYYSKIALLDKQKRFDEAIVAAKEAIAFIENAPAEECCTKADLINDFTAWIEKLEAKKTSR